MFAAPLLLIVIVVSILFSLWVYYDRLAKKRKSMQSRQELLLREGRVCIDKGLKVEETAHLNRLSDDPVYLSEARN